MEFFEEIVPTLTDSAQEASAAADVLKERTGQLAIKAVPLSEKIHHVAIIGSNYERSRHFYVDLLGFTVIRENHRKDKADCKIDLKCGEQEIELFIKPDAPKRPSYPEAQGTSTSRIFCGERGEYGCAVKQPRNCDRADPYR